MDDLDMVAGAAGFSHLQPAFVEVNTLYPTVGRKRRFSEEEEAGPSSKRSFHDKDAQVCHCGHSSVSHEALKLTFIPRPGPYERERPISSSTLCGAEADVPAL